MRYDSTIIIRFKFFKAVFNVLSLILRNKNAFISIIFLIILILLSRFIWIFWAIGFSENFWNGYLTFTTPDSYTFATILQKAIFGLHLHNPYISGLLENGAITLTPYVLIKYLHFPFETTLFYFPVFFAVLMPLGLFITSRLFLSNKKSFLVAVLAGVSLSYYNRTMAGYFDTDVFAISIPLFSIYFFIKGIKSKEFRYFFISSLILAAYPFFYTRGDSLAFAIAFVAIIFHFYHFRNAQSWNVLVMFSCTGIMGEGIGVWGFRVAYVIINYILLTKLNFKSKVLFFFYSFFIIILLVYQGENNPVLSKVMLYSGSSSVSGMVTKLVDNETSREGPLLSPVFSNNIRSVYEARPVNLKYLGKRIAGNEYLFILGLIGYILFCFRFKEGILFIPFLGLAFYSIWGGLRFTIYGTPCIALGYVYLFNFLSVYLFKNNNIQRLLIIVAIILYLMPNLEHILNYKPFVTTPKSQAIALDKIKKHSKSNATVMSWWDYSYIISYFSERKSFLPFNSIGGEFSYIMAKIFSQANASRAGELSRWVIERSPAELVNKIYNHGVGDVTKNLDALLKSTQPLNQKNEVYMFLPSEILPKFDVIYNFSNINLNNGKISSVFSYKFFNKYLTTENKVIFPNGMWLERSSFKLFTKSNIPVSINSAHIIKRLESGVLNTMSSIFDTSSHLHLIYSVTYKSYLLLDSRLLNTAYIQMFLFENYNPEVWEAFYISPKVKVYKLKI